LLLCGIRVLFLSYVCHQFRCRSSPQIPFSVLFSLFVSYLLSPYVSPPRLSVIPKQKQHPVCSSWGAGACGFVCYFVFSSAQSNTVLGEVTFRSLIFLKPTQQFSQHVSSVTEYNRNLHSFLTLM
jgi:hypothetical protein